ncbi:MAG: hypothetical protein QF543_05005, partial [Dehalococcoidales bacterium]|nr:hypothetical protein [Dehalococcoidales bacterium]
LQAVARAWTLAFGVMSEQSFAEQVPEAYGLRHDVQSLRDAEPELDQQVQKDARAFAEASVQAVQGLVFPTHGLAV